MGICCVFEIYIFNITNIAPTPKIPELFYENYQSSLFLTTTGHNHLSIDYDTDTLSPACPLQIFSEI